MPALEVGSTLRHRCVALLCWAARCCAVPLCHAAVLSCAVLCRCAFATGDRLPWGRQPFPAACMRGAAAQPSAPPSLLLPLSAPPDEQFLAHKMRMAPDVAGVTLFAFASGAPDLFTQIAAVAAGGHVDQELAIRCVWTAEACALSMWTAKAFAPSMWTAEAFAPGRGVCAVDQKLLQCLWCSTRQKVLVWNIARTAVWQGQFSAVWCAAAMHPLYALPMPFLACPLGPCPAAPPWAAACSSCPLSL